MNTHVTIHGLEKLQQRTAVIALKTLAIIAVLYTLYFCRTLLLPIFVAGFIALFSSPFVRVLTSYRVPHALAAGIVVALLFLGLLFALMFLFEPASQWVNNLPKLGHRLNVELGSVFKSIENLKSGLLAEQDSSSAMSGLMETVALSAFSLVAGTTALFIMQVFAVFVITYFFLEYGDNLMRSLVRSQSSFSEKKKTVIIFQTARDDISHYVMVVFTINVGLGAATAAVMALLGVEDPILWGTLATILNFAPYIGPLLLAVILTGVGLIEYDSLGYALMVPGTFLILNFLESQLVTPTVLGQRFNMNPLLVVLWMFVWGWVWGVIGLLIAIPLLVCFKILSHHLDLIGGWIAILDSENDKNKLQ